MNPCWTSVRAAADAATASRDWRRDETEPATQARYLSEVKDGFASVVHIDPGEGSTITADGKLLVGESVDVLVGATYLPAERMLANKGYRPAAIEISDPDWDIDAHVLSRADLLEPALAAVVTNVIMGAMTAAEHFAIGHASPAKFVSAIELELQGDSAEVRDFLAIPAVLVAAGLCDEARVAIDRGRRRVGQCAPDAFWAEARTLLDAVPRDDRM